MEHDSNASGSPEPSRNSLKPKDWKDVCSGIQAVCATVLALLGIYAFFFSPLSRVAEDHLRTEVIAAKQELVAARDAKARIEQDKQTLIASTAKLSDARDQLKSDIATLEKQLSALDNKRTAYARSAAASPTGGVPRAYAPRPA
jgi:hypothetical protein